MRYVCRAVLPAGRPSFVMNSPRVVRGVIRGASDMLCTPCLQCMHACLLVILIMKVSNMWLVRALVMRRRL